MIFLVYLGMAALGLTGPQQPGPAATSSGADTQQTADAWTLNPDELPVSVPKIQRALSRPPAIKLNTDKPVFRVEVLGTFPSIIEFLGTDFLRGPVPMGAMTHQEFLNMVTPKDVQGYAAFSNREGAAVAASSFAFALLQSAVLKAITKYSEATREREKEAARQEVMAALAELDRARQKAGLPPR